jgi:hypothetical protein
MLWINKICTSRSMAIRDFSYLVKRGRIEEERKRRKERRGKGRKLFHVLYFPFPALLCASVAVKRREKKTKRNKKFK